MTFLSPSGCFQSRGLQKLPLGHTPKAADLLFISFAAQPIKVQFLYLCYNVYDTLTPGRIGVYACIILNFVNIYGGSIS